MHICLGLFPTTEWFAKERGLIRLPNLKQGMLTGSGCKREVYEVHEIWWNCYETHCFLQSTHTDNSKYWLLLKLKKYKTKRKKPNQIQTRVNKQQQGVFSRVHIPVSLLISMAFGVLLITKAEVHFFYCSLHTKTLCQSLFCMRNKLVLRAHNLRLFNKGPQWLPLNLRGKLQVKPSSKLNTGKSPLEVSPGTLVTWG